MSVQRSWCAAVLLLALAPVSTAWAQRESGLSIADDEATEPYTPPPPAELPRGRRSAYDVNPGVPTFMRRVDDGFGAQLRASHYAGDAVGRDASISPFELFSYYIWDNAMIFSDTRVFVTNRGQVGGNFGVGYRYFDPGWNRVVGGSVWYDGDNSTTNYFQQVGLSLETYGRRWDARLNGYLPVSDTQQTLSFGAVPGSTRFAGTNIVYDTAQNVVAALRGFDMEAGLLIPGEWAEQFDLRAYAGTYYFEGNDVDQSWGWKGRVQAAVIPPLDLQLEVTHDQIFDTNVVLGATWTFGKFERDPTGRTAYSRIGERVRRNYNIVAYRDAIYRRGIVAMNPATSSAYVVRHVSSAAAPGGNGTAEQPFATIDTAQLGNPDVVFVESGSVFTGSAASITLNPGVRLLGQGVGVQNIIQVEGFGPVALPEGTGARPVLLNPAGDGVTLGAGSELAGFTIQNPTGNGIVASGAGGALVRSVTVNGAALDGVSLSNTDGLYVFNDVHVNNALGTGFNVNGGSAAIRFLGRIDNAAGRLLAVRNTSAPSLVNFTGSILNGTGGQGLLVQHSAGTSIFDGLTLAGTTGPGIDLRDNNGAVSFLNTTSITGANGNSVNIEDLADGGTVNFSNLTIAARQGRGLFINRADGDVTVSGQTSISNAANSTASAIDIRNSDGDQTFNGTGVTAATGDPAVNLEANTGTTRFQTLDVTTDGGTAVRALNAGNVQVVTGGTINAVNGTALDLQGSALNMALTSVSSSNAAFGIRMVDTTGQLGVYGTGSLGSGGTIQDATTAIFLDNVGTVGFGDMDFLDNGTGIAMTDADHVEIVEARISGTTGIAVDALNTGALLMNGSILQNNGQNVRLQYDAVGNYGVAITQTRFSSIAGDNIQINSLAGSAGSNLLLTVRGNEFINNGANDDAIAVNWTGGLNATFGENQFTTTGAGANALNVTAGALGSSTSLQFLGNGFDMRGDNSTAIRMGTAGPATVTFDTNDIAFAGLSGTGFNLSTAASATMSFLNNVVTDNADGGTGILFNSVSGPSQIAINNNLLRFANNGVLADRGIVFNTVNTAGGAVLLQGTVNNTVQNASSIFTSPFGTLQGSFLLNGVRVP